MKRILCLFLCLFLCLSLLAPAAMADSYTPRKLFRQQFITGGNGVRGTVSITAQGSAEWLDVLLPFTASSLEVRIIGEKQGEMSELVTDDDDWQVKLFAKDSAGEQQGVTWVYGDPDGLYIKSDLLPDTLLTLPVKNVNLPYLLADGEALQLLSAFDPLSLMGQTDGGNAEAWSALAGLAEITPEEWEADWAPVLDKYSVLLDMWLAEFASPTVVTEGRNGMSLRTTYDIPVENLKAQAKYMVSLLVNDADIQRLMTPYLTEEQRSLYLNPAMVYFYNYVIDLAPLEGSIQLEREMTAMGESSSMMISLPLPQLPEELTDALGSLLVGALSLPYEDVFADLQRMSIRQSGDDLSVSLTSPHRTITLIVDEQAESAEAIQLAGYLRITPAVGSDEPPLSAAFTYAASEKITEDEEYNTHEDLTLSLSVTPDLSLMEADDPFHSLYLDFAPLSLEAAVGFTRKEQSGSPIQLSITINSALPEATIGLTASLKTASRWNHELLPTEGAENLLSLDAARLEALRTMLIENAITTMTTLNAPVADGQ